VTNTIVSATQIGPNTLSIFVDAAYTASFLNFLKEKKVDCELPSTAIFRTRRIYIDGIEREKVEEEILVNEIIAAGTLDDLRNWIDYWILPPSDL
jgi:hypothetical protein